MSAQKDLEELVRAEIDKRVGEMPQKKDGASWRMPLPTYYAEQIAKDLIAGGVPWEMIVKYLNAHGAGFTGLTIARLAGGSLDVVRRL